MKRRQNKKWEIKEKEEREIILITQKLGKSLTIRSSPLV